MLESYMSEYNIDKSKMMIRLHRICGQVQAIENMIENDAYCTDVLMQLSATTAALRSVAVLVARAQISECLEDVSYSDNAELLDKKTSEVIKVVDRLMKYDKS
ncbi:putative copper-sensing transcriptional repressor CsoR [Gardnerella vaginalis]|uniref:Putative copper-sensing transcriptional repressor CsoR n=2 Tax=Bifidobacteriaceae TaxID=31953 RepID=A0A135Z5C0_GARVA|nr:putative copper-sensing transcriptional repressor CsoR [Gardnerella vaginalis]